MNNTISSLSQLPLHYRNLFIDRFNTALSFRTTCRAACYVVDAWWQEVDGTPLKDRIEKTISLRMTARCLELYDGQIDEETLIRRYKDRQEVVNSRLLKSEIADATIVYLEEELTGPNLVLHYLELTHKFLRNQKIDVLSEDDIKWLRTLIYKSEGDILAFQSLLFLVKSVKDDSILCERLIKDIAKPFGSCWIRRRGAYEPLESLVDYETNQRHLKQYKEIFELIMACKCKPSESFLSQTYQRISNLIKSDSKNGAII